jgi:succinoglycan biosynthesis transport protein ExoP
VAISPSRSHIRALREQWRLGAGIIVICVAGGLAFAFAQPAPDHATATLLVTPGRAKIATLPQLAGTQDVLARASRATGVTIEALRRSVHAGEIRGELIDVTASASSAASAAARANAVAHALADVRTNVDVVAPATSASSSQTSPHLALDGLIGFLVGLVLAVAVLLARDARDRRPRTSAEIEDMWELPIVTTMRNVGLNGRSPPEIVDGYRSVRTNLFLRSGGDLPHAVIVTSAVENVCKSAVAAHLAQALAASGYRVIAVSVDLRNPGLQQHLGVEDSTGIAELFADDVPPKDVVTSVPLSIDDADGTGSLDLLAHASPVLDRSTSLVSPAIEELFADLQEDYHVVVIDAPPLLPASETALLAQRPGMRMLIVEQSGSTEPHEIEGALERLALAGVDPLGLVVCGLDSD